jgi:hypothetical protein
MVSAGTQSKGWNTYYYGVKKGQSNMGLGRYMTCRPRRAENLCRWESLLVSKFGCPLAYAVNCDLAVSLDKLQFCDGVSLE